MPVLMITAANDPVLTPEMTNRENISFFCFFWLVSQTISLFTFILLLAETDMEMFIPHLKRDHIENCGHWIQTEHPERVNQSLRSFFEYVLQSKSNLWWREINWFHWWINVFRTKFWPSKADSKYVMLKKSQIYFLCLISMRYEDIYEGSTWKSKIRDIHPSAWSFDWS